MIASNGSITVVPLAVVAVSLFIIAASITIGPKEILRAVLSLAIASVVPSVATFNFAAIPSLTLVISSSVFNVFSSTNLAPLAAVFSALVNET